ncbi:MAG TPA: diguanylate cyclase, partial [Candidatus Obscuribacterales bacterium]
VGNVQPAAVAQPVWPAVGAAPADSPPRADRNTRGASSQQPPIAARLGELAHAAAEAPAAVRPGVTSDQPATAEQHPARHVIPLAAQDVIKDIIDGLRHSSDLDAMLQRAISRLTVAGKAHRGLIWQVVGDRLTVTNEFSVSGHTPFVGTQLGSEESTAIMLEFLSRFPDESGVGAISIPDTYQDTSLHKLSTTLASLIELGDVRARLVAQLRCRGQIAGFLELQQCNQTRLWSDEDGAVLQHVANTLSVVVQQARDQAKIEFDAHRMKLVNQIADLFRESKGEKIHDTILKSIGLIKETLGFVNAQIYLYSAEDGFLIPQIPGARQVPVELSAKDNPFVSVYDSARERTINLEYTRKGDPFFGHDTAVIVPLLHEGERLGVMGLWERLPDKPQIGPSDRELARTVAGQLSSVIRADQAIAHIRAEQARAALINKVSSEIRQSLKEDVDPVMDTLVQSLHEYFGLALAVVSHFDEQAGDFVKSKSAGSMAGEQSPLAPNFGEVVFLSMLEELKQGRIIFLTADDIAQKLAQRETTMPAGIKSATLVPLVHAGTFKGALCMVSVDRAHPFPEMDMKMVADLADRVAVVISHHELYKQVERQAVTDPMTGLYNRRHFSEQMSKEIDRFQRFGHPFSYIIIDLDYLKKINDSLGHQFGDAAIKHIAQVLKRTTRDVDTAARYGGEEFVILLPVTDLKAARIAAERICAAIREKPVEGIGTVTASVGVATFPTDADDRDKLTELADQALYLAKHRGRNQVCSVSEDLMPSLSKRGEEALEVQQHALQKKAEEMAPLDIKVIAEHGILGLMGAVVKIIEARDAYNKDRSPKAAEYASRLAQSLHLSKEHVTIISLAAVLNNLGKIAMPEEILQKKGPLTAEERRMIQQSPVIGAKILEPAKHLHRVATVIEAYHEHWDGTGYPKGLKGEEIPLESRIIALVDAYIAMTSDRPYRPALSHEEALRLIQEGSGKEWDPRLVKLFLSILQKERGAAGAGKA